LVLDLQDRIGGATAKIANLRSAKRFLPDNIYDAMDNFNKSRVDHQTVWRRREGAVLGSEESLGGSLPAAAGTVVKSPEIQFHHEVYNQYLWNQF